MFFFFFQAVDGIRDTSVTGVQTCALPISAKAKVATQMGIQIHANENYHRVVELVQSGAIGSITEAHVWVSRAWGWQSEADAKRHGDIVSVRERPKQSDPVPPGLD